MTVSSTSSFILDARGVINLAVSRVGGEESTGWEWRMARMNLQLLFQEMQMRGVNLWTVEFAEQALTLDDGDYTLSADVIDVLDMSVYDSSDSPRTDLPVERISRADYEMKPDKTQNGLPYQCFVDKQRDDITLYLYQIPSISTYVLRYWYVRRLYDQTSFSDNLDVPVRWLPAIVSGLAYYMGRARRTTLGLEFVRELEREWERDYQIASVNDQDSAALRFQPDLSNYFS